MSSLEHPVEMLRRLSRIVVQYGNDVETYGGRANLLMADVTEAITARDTAHHTTVMAETELSTWMRSDEYSQWIAGANTDATSATLLARNERYRDSATTAQDSLAQAEETLTEAWMAWETQFSFWDDAYARAVASLAGVDARFDGSSDSGTVSNPADPNLTRLADADTPEEVAAAWDSLSDAERERLAATYPEFVGNLEGIPYEYRIAANVAVLEEASETSWGDPTDTEIEKLLIELNRKGGLPVSLNLFDKNQGTAALLYVDGVTFDPDKLSDPLAGVTNVSVLVAGMMSQLNGIGDWGGSAADMNDYIAEAGGTGATIVWFGYDSPNFATEPSTAQAVVGAETLTGFLRGLDQAAPPNAVTTVIGHSYGSTTAFLAVGSAADNLGVDNLIAVGSAGLTDHALGTDPDARVDYSGTNVFATTSPDDALARIGRLSPHPIDPGSIDGAVSFDSDGGYTPNLDGSEPTWEQHDGTPLLNTPGHGTHSEGTIPLPWDQPGGYLQDGSESFANIIGVITDGEPVTTPGGFGSQNALQG
ncbi:alpha/beta hydrolase [Microbacterium sp. NPDC087665]|uniref:alpha/beta hydrolase n=1 Tax=Microbacterium sp. NPDC087665 TaxID=3364194 RepID=UPI00382F40EE